jgi:ADP-heptose:LPS heptosyltransferase
MAGPQILIIHQGAIGDLVLSLPALQTIKNSFPGRAIEMLGYPDILSLVGGDFAHTIRSADWAPASTLYGDYENISAQVQQYLAGFERLFIFSAQVKSAFIKNVQRCHPQAIHIRTFPDTARHVVDYQLGQLAALGFAPAESVPQLSVSSDERRRADDFLRSNDFDAALGPLIAVHAGSGGRHKCWPSALFCAVMRGLHEERRAAFLLVEGPAEEKTVGEMTAALSALPCLPLHNLDLPLVAALLSRSTLFIGNDSGITHMAAAVGIPTVAVFGPTDPAVWGPRGKSVCIVRECDADGQWRWPEPGAVLREARALLGGVVGRLTKDGCSS